MLETQSVRRSICFLSQPCLIFLYILATCCLIFLFSLQLQNSLCYLLQAFRCRIELERRRETRRAVKRGIADSAGEVVTHMTSRQRLPRTPLPCVSHWERWGNSREEGVSDAITVIPLSSLSRSNYSCFSLCFAYFPLPFGFIETTAS